MSNLRLEETLAMKAKSFPLKSYLWRVVLPDISAPHYGIENYGPAGATPPNFGGHMLNLDHRVSSITTPFPTIETDKASMGNSFWYMAKHNDIGNITMEMQEYEDGLTLRYLMAWMGLISNDNGTYNPPVYYKRDIMVFRLSSTKEDLIKHTYQNYFISGISEISSDYSNSDIMKYNVTFTGDSVISETTKIANLQEKPKEMEILEEELRLKKRFRGIGGGSMNKITANFVNRVIDGQGFGI